MASIDVVNGATAGVRVRPATPARAGANPHVYACFLALAVIGYPVAGVLTTVLQFEGSNISYVFRASVIALAVVVSWQALFGRTIQALPLVFIVFLALYSVRLYYDSFISYIPDADYAIFYFFGVCLIPAIGTALASASYDHEKHAIWTFIVGGFASVSIVGIELLGLAGAASRTEEIGRLSFQALNPITVGYAGLFTVVAAVFLWFRVSPHLRPILVVVGLIAGYSFIQAASRGPFVAGVLCIAVAALARRRYFLFAALIAAGAYGAFFVSDSNLELVSRFESVTYDESSSERLYYMANAIQQAIENPVFGHAFVETISYRYPHNLLVESGLALGMVGAALMILIYVQLLIHSWRLAAHGYMFLALLMLSALVNANVSAALWGAPDFWIAAILGHIMVRRLKEQHSATIAQRAPDGQPQPVLSGGAIVPASH
jgi:hypothetical protein